MNSGELMTFSLVRKNAWSMTSVYTITGLPHTLAQQPWLHIFILKIYLISGRGVTRNCVAGK